MKRRALNSEVSELLPQESRDLFAGGGAERGEWCESNKIEFAFWYWSVWCTCRNARYTPLTTTNRFSISATEKKGKKVHFNYHIESYFNLFGSIDLHNCVSSPSVATARRTSHVAIDCVNHSFIHYSQLWSFVSFIFFFYVFCGFINLHLFFYSPKNRSIILGYPANTTSSSLRQQ